MTIGDRQGTRPQLAAGAARFVDVTPALGMIPPWPFAAARAY
jgi:hypothetical protein